MRACTDAADRSGPDDRGRLIRCGLHPAFPWQGEGRPYQCDPGLSVCNYRGLDTGTFTLLRGVVFLVPSFLLMPRIAGTHGIWLALSVSELLTFAVLLLYLTVTRHRKQIH